MILLGVVLGALVLLVGRGRLRKRGRAATGADVLAAASSSGPSFPGVTVLPGQRDPAGGRVVGF